MGTDPKLSQAYILQDDVIRDYIPSIGTQQWQVLYETKEPSPDTFSVYSGLVPRGKVSTALSREGWDLSIGDDLPGSIESGKAKKSDIRPLVIFRHFHDAWPEYLEICEEFRHFHDLAEDREHGTLLTFDGSGYPIEVIRVQPERVEISLPFLFQFLAAKRLHLAVFLDVRRFSQLALHNIPEAERDLRHADDRSCYHRHVGPGLSFQPSFPTFSRLVGKVVVSPPPVKKHGKGPSRDRDSNPEVSFIIGINADGTPREFSSQRDKLSNNFDAKGGAPHYHFTFVYFRREVLSKYYADPDRYYVADEELSCKNLWTLPIDNNHPTHVVVSLGYLGQSLPYEERLHWRQFNVPPEEGVSKAYFRRGFLGEFAPPEAADLVFRWEYQKLGRAWREMTGWPLYLEPEAGDEYLLNTIRVPVTSSQSEFDQQVLTLTKLLVDSLNEQAILSEIGGPGEKDEKGIAKLDRFLTIRDFPERAKVIKFLRDLQALRSASAGHRKGKHYDKTLAKLGYDAQGKPELMERLLREATVVLRSLHEHFCRETRPRVQPSGIVERGPTMKHQALTLLIYYLNRLLDTGRYDDISLEEVSSHIEDGSILQFIQTRAGKDIHFDLFLKTRTYGNFERFYVTYLQSLLDVHGDDAWGVSNRGLCLLIALTNEILQQGSDWRPDPDIAGVEYT
jgi:hypothetical protein